MPWIKLYSSQDEGEGGERDRQVPDQYGRNITALTGDHRHDDDDDEQGWLQDWTSFTSSSSSDQREFPLSHTCTHTV
jgi:hypothetical protein